MKPIKFLFASIAFAGFTTLSQAAGFLFSFDTNNEGWTKGNFGSGLANIDNDTNGAANWSGGQLNGNDHSGYAFLFSPDLGGSRGSLFGETLSFDFGSNSAGPTNPQVVLKSGSGFLVKEVSIVANFGTDPYAYTLNAAGGWFFNSSNYYGTGVLATDADVQGVLNDLRYVGISTDINGGGDTTRLDNVRAGQPVPEPASMLALGLGGLLLKRRRSARA